MKGYRHHVYSAVFAALMLLGAPGAAMADCTNPNYPAGAMTWNGTDSIIWCDGTNWYALKNAGASGSAGYIQFSGGSGGFSNSGATSGQQLFWDNTNKRLGIGTASPSEALTVNGNPEFQGASKKLRIVPDSTGITYLQVGTDNTDATGEIRLTRYKTTSTSFAKFSSYATTNYLAGNVGIGITTPAAALHVSGTDSTAYVSSSASAYSPADLSSPAAPMVLIANTANLDGQGVYLNLLSKNAVADGQRAYIGAVSNSTGRAPTIVFGQQTALAAYAERMRITATGNVGIGTTTPSGALYVKGNTVLSDDTANVTASYPLRVYSASSSSGLVNLYYQNADTNGAALSLQKYKSGGNEIAAGDILGSIDFFGTTGAGNSLRAAQIRATAETGWGGTGDSPGRLTFWTTPDGSSTAAERMRIDNAGNVGIGTSTPAAKLDVNGFMRLAKNGSAPATCDATIDGAIALTSQYTLCACKGGSSAWVITSDGTTACTW